MEVVKTQKSISTYQIYDDDKFSVVKIELPEGAQGVTEQWIKSDFQKGFFNLQKNTRRRYICFQSNKIIFCNWSGKI